MKRLIQATLAIGFILGSVSSAGACGLWPFCGWWGAGYAPAYGYAGAPAYGYAAAPTAGYYTAAYPSFGQPVYGNYYSAGYASASNCCVSSCCNSCGGGACGTGACASGACASGACASGSCAGITSYGSGTLKPANDPNFRNGTTIDEYNEDRDRLRELDRDRLRELDRDREESRTDSPGEFEPPVRSRDNEADPDDDFSASGLGNTGRGGSVPFDLDDERINNKPPMPNLPIGGLPNGDLPAVDPEDGSTFLDGEKNESDNQTRLEQRQKRLTGRSSRLSEVITPRRLASRSLPSTSSRRATSWAGKTAAGKTAAGKTSSDIRVRWISVPMPDGQVRL